MIAARFPDGRLHLQQGPIDLIVEAFGAHEEVEAAYRQAIDRFGDILPTLVRELPTLRQSVGAAYPFTLELTQQGQVVTGRYALADIWVDLTPTAISDQNVTLTGAGRIDSAGVRVNVTWSVSVGRPSLRGTAVMEWTADAGGDATLRATVAGLALLPSS